ncbi:5-dehydro-4-deoxy-D-glucuronate isomerase [Algoriphagus halophytocola]|uniref:4-deoxy-L-threo-5-hexosulose-uronate ketol-isomerase n=1 Tax=Algoriphagus halophytocola TaxID=2991499 RepID=A0ABY6MLW0_9BACT|nr:MULTISPECIES: 5-dehydro-4-deoxy-D-glucuronate isomerase [unclassified Algoriphagus]UZD24529.1 5-dehydro-4-deoxy-D-glucuronate isomerase [Algoriphagus sp. TR-M5]WBL41893.1 5-dehydro-4-deoxy-D-glucuronate isomerase [Algoriphagus sp. TR-M9]
MSIAIETRYSSHPEDFKKYQTTEIREKFLLEQIFVPNQITGVYTMEDRLIVGGINPVDRPVTLEPVDQLKAEYFLERRELGIINVGAPASITVDGEDFSLSHKEALYIGKGVREVIFHPSKEGEALIYFNSAPAHAAYPTKKVSQDDAEVVTLGSLENSNHRTIYKLLVNSVVQTCQLQMGMTELKPGSVWNTMPAHTHDRRMEAYFYFDLAEGNTISHYLGQPDETRHIWMKNHQAVLSPVWSIHSGAGTSNYTFIWGMAGENLDYGDMDVVAPTDLK